MPWTVWPEKNRQTSIKVAQIWFHLKKKDFDTFNKVAFKYGDVGKKIIITGFEKLAKAWSSLVEGGEGSYLPKW